MSFIKNIPHEEIITLADQVPHAVYAKEDFKMMLTVVFPE